MKNLKKLLTTILILAALILVCVLLSMRRTEDFHEKYAGVDLDAQISGLLREGTYGGYLKEHDAAALAKEDVEIRLSDYACEEGEVRPPPLR